MQLSVVDVCRPSHGFVNAPPQSMYFQDKVKLLKEHFALFEAEMANRKQNSDDGSTVGSDYDSFDLQRSYSGDSAGSHYTSASSRSELSMSSANSLYSSYSNTDSTFSPDVIDRKTLKYVEINVKCFTSSRMLTVSVFAWPFSYTTHPPAHPYAHTSMCTVIKACALIDTLTHPRMHIGRNGSQWK